jgi:hypothetical protein
LIVRTRKLVATAVTAALIIPAAALPAAAKDGDVERSGACGRRSDWKLKLSPEDGRIEVEFEVDQNVNGHRWRVVMGHDGKRFFKGHRTTHAPSGSFELRRVANNHRGLDRFKAQARNLSTGEVCRGTAAF